MGTHIPEPVQKRILEQAWTVFDTEPVTSQLKQELAAFVNKHLITKKSAGLMSKGPSPF
jgi:hypothetical protein